MNEAIELHDSDLAAVKVAGDAVILCFHPAYIHRSAGKPGIDAGTGWTQDATITISGAPKVEATSDRYRAVLLHARALHLRRFAP